MQWDEHGIQRELRLRSPLRAREKIVAHGKDEHRARQIRRVRTVRELVPDGIAVTAGGQGDVRWTVWHELAGVL